MRIPLPTRSTSLAFVAALILAAGFSNLSNNQAQAADRDAARVPANSSSTSNPATAGLFKAQPIQSEKMPETIAAAYSEAAEACGPFCKAMPYERAKILDSAIPLLRKLVTANDQSQRQNSKAQDAVQLLTLDYRFSELWNQKEIQAVIRSASNSLTAPSMQLAKTSVKDPGGLPQPEAPQNPPEGQPLVVGRISPDAVVAFAGLLGEAAAAKVRAMHLDAVMTSEAQRLLGLALPKGDSWQEVLELKSADTLETRAAKVAVRASFGDLFGKIVAFRGSYFLKVEPNGRAPEIWEFKGGIALGLEREEPDIRTKLNTGVQLIVPMKYYAGNFFRRYANGWWSSWGDFEPLGDIKILKADNWTIEPPQGVVRPRFLRPSAQELELSLSRSDSTKLVGQAEAALTNSLGRELSEEDASTLLVVYTAHGNAAGAHQCAQLLLGHQPRAAAAAKQAAAALANLLATENPAIAADLFRAKLFDYYQPYKEFPENGEMIKLPTPKRDTAKHPYGTNSIVETAEELKRAYRAVLEQEPQNLDAQFDLALLCMLGENASRGDALDCLRAAVKSDGPSPDSGREFRKIITGSPSFFLLRVQHGSTENQFRGLLRSLGSSDVQYGAKFSKHVQYYNSGY